MTGPARTLWRKASPRNATDEGLLPATTQTPYLSPSVSLLRISIFGPETRRGTDKAAHLSVSQLGNRNFDPELRRDTDTTSEWLVSWQRKNSESRTRNTPFPSTRVAREGDYHTGRRLSGSSGSFCCLSVLNDNGGLFRQTDAQRPRAGVSVGHTDVRHSLISAVGAHSSASDVVCGGSLCLSLKKVDFQSSKRWERQKRTRLCITMR